MLVGLTYDLKDEYLLEGRDAEQVAEFDSVQTIDAIEDALSHLGYRTIRIGNIRSLVSFLARGKSCDVVFNIAEGLHGLCREAQIPALLDAYGIPYVFSDSFVLAVALHKGLAKAVVGRYGVPTPDYAVVSSMADIDGIFLSYPLFVKPVGGGTGMGIAASSVVRNRQELTATVSMLLERFSQPVLVETFLAGREFTVGITGTGVASRCIATMEILVDPASDFGIYSYRTKRDYLLAARYRLAEGPVAASCEQVALGAWRALGCRDGGRVDLKMDGNGKVHFLEVNPLAGLHPVDSDLPILSYLVGIDYRHLIGRIMDSAMSRLGTTEHVA